MKQTETGRIISSLAELPTDDDTISTEFAQELLNQDMVGRHPTVHLLNAAVMPQPGFYDMQAIDAETFTELVQIAEELGQLKHYIGYKSTLTFVEHLAGIDLQGTNGDKTVMADGDVFLVIRLKYRVNPQQKRADTPEIRDFEFFKGSYAEAQDR